MNRLVIVIAASVPAASCVLGPNYRRPAVAVPAAFRDTTATTAQAESRSLAALNWFDLFKDDTLTELVRAALVQNFDLKIAAERVLQAREQFGIVRAERLPVVVGSAGAAQIRVSESGARPLAPGSDPDISDFQAGFGLGWELDVWGRIRRLKEAARAQYLSSEEARHAVITTLIGDVSANYFNLREADLELSIAQQTLGDAENGLRLTTLRKNGGTATSID